MENQEEAHVSWLRLCSALAIAAIREWTSNRKSHIFILSLSLSLSNSVFQIDFKRCWQTSQSQLAEAKIRLRIIYDLDLINTLFQQKHSKVHFISLSPQRSRSWQSQRYSKSGHIWKAQHLRPELLDTKNNWGARKIKDHKEVKQKPELIPSCIEPKERQY